MGLCVKRVFRDVVFGRNILLFIGWRGTTRCVNKNRFEVEFEAVLFGGGFVDLVADAPDFAYPGLPSFTASRFPSYILYANQPSGMHSMDGTN